LSLEEKSTKYNCRHNFSKRNEERRINERAIVDLGQKERKHRIESEVVSEHGLNMAAQTDSDTIEFLVHDRNRPSLDSLELTTTSVGDGETVKWMDKDGIDGINDRNGA